eukprot:6456830-Amphidinium_carterae.3
MHRHSVALGSPVASCACHFHLAATPHNKANCCLSSGFYAPMIASRHVARATNTYRKNGLILVAVLKCGSLSYKHCGQHRPFRNTPTLQFEGSLSHPT